MWCDEGGLPAVFGRAVGLDAFGECLTEQGGNTLGGVLFDGLDGGEGSFHVVGEQHGADGTSDEDGDLVVVGLHVAAVVWGQFGGSCGCSF